MLKSLLKLSSIAPLAAPMVISNTAAMPDPGLYCYQVLPNGQVVNLRNLCSPAPQAPSPQVKPVAKPVASSGVQPKTNTGSYPPIIGQTFINACVGGRNSSAIRSFCTCAFKKIESRYTLEEFLQLSQQVRPSREMPAEVRNLLSSCLAANR